MERVLFNAEGVPLESLGISIKVDVFAEHGSHRSAGMNTDHM